MFLQFETYYSFIFYFLFYVLFQDSEARIQSWTVLLCTTLGLFQQQPDIKFRLLQPAIFYCVNQLVCHGEDKRLREALGQWVHRIGIMIDCIT